MNFWEQVMSVVSPCPLVEFMFPVEDMFCRFWRVQLGETVRDFGPKGSDPNFRQLQLFN